MIRTMTASLMLIALPLQAQAPLSPAAARPAMPACAGKFATIRVSAIKPGQAALFDRAVADHAAWYKSHGDATEVHRMPLMKADPTTHLTSYDSDTVLTMTVYAAAARPGDDAAWKAFVKEYQDSSDIKSEYRTCMAS